MPTKKSGEKTLLWSVFMSAPGPLVVGLGLLTGQSSTQMADFVRRSAELLAIIVSYIVYKMTMNSAVQHIAYKQKLERRASIFVGMMMGLGGTLMVVITFMNDSADKGNVIPGLVIALLGVIANSIFWFKYRRLHMQEPNAILNVQATLYRTKTLVDGCVLVALLTVIITPGSPIATAFDFTGSLIVALYLVWSGGRTVYEVFKTN